MFVFRIPAIAGLLCLLACTSNSLEPLTGTVVIQYTVAQEATVRIEIENSYNTAITTLTDRLHAPGTYSISWLPAGDEAVEGIYYSLLYENKVLKQRRELLLVGGR